MERHPALAVVKYNLMSKSVIYKILNTINCNFYIVSAIDYSRRLREHRSMLKLNKHHCKHLQNAVNKYGIENFVITIVEEVDAYDLIVKEQFYIDNLLPIYNSNPVAGNSLGFKHSEETKLKISNGRLGNKWSEGRILSQETRNKIAKAKSCRVQQYTLAGALLNEFNSLKEASELTGVNIYYIKCFSSGEIKNGGGFIWKRKK